MRTYTSPSTASRPVNDIYIRANDSFEDRFRYDDEGVPRIWKPSDDIDGLFKSAREEVSLVFI